VVMAQNLARGFVLISDLGDTTYLSILNPDNADSLLEHAIDALIRWQRASRLGSLQSVDERTLRQEMSLFRRWYVKRHLGVISDSSSRRALEGVFDAIVANNLSQPIVYMHHDYTARNLMVCDPNPGVLDFQDALMAPAAQDLAVLLTTRDTARVIAPKIERRILDYYYAALIRRDAPQLPVEEFRESYRLCVLQHALKVIGRFIVLEHQGKSGYREYIPYALEQARRMLVPGQFPNLHAVLAA